MRQIAAKGILWVLCGALCSTVAGAQSAPRFGTIFVTVVDTSNAPPVRPFSVVTFVPSSPGNRDIFKDAPSVEVSPGRFRIDSVPQDPAGIVVMCPTIKMFAMAATRAEVHLSVRAGETLYTTIKVNHAGCDPRPIRSEYRVFTGFYTSAFEESSFVPCGNDNWMTAGDSLAMQKWEPRAWVKWTNAGYGTIPSVTLTPKTRKDSYGQPQLYARLRGTMKGPGHYGHMGISEFEFTVDSVLAMSATAPKSCSPLAARKPARSRKGAGH
jgi:hypothetical protein